jgi:acyl carrier protein
VLKLYLGAAVGAVSYAQIQAALGPLADRLPLEIYQVEQLPRAAGGSVAVAQLEHIGQRLQPENLVTAAPMNEIEQRLLEIWQEVLGTTNITIYSNFFAIGGHSLLATQLVSRLRESFNVEIVMQQLFAVPTIAALAQVVMQAQMAQIDESVMSAIFAEVDGLSPEELAQLLGV